MNLEPNLCDINARNVFGMAPFHISCALSNFNDVKIMLGNENLDPNTVNKFGHTPFYLVCSNVDCKQPGKLFALIETLKILLKDERIDKFKADLNGVTPIQRAISNGCLEVLNLLIEFGYAGVK